MKEMTVGDRVLEGDSLGTVSSEPLKCEENHKNSVCDCKLLVKPDDLTNGELEEGSKKLENFKKIKVKIFEYFDKIKENSMNFEELTRILSERFDFHDFSNPNSCVNLDSVSLGSTFEREFRNKYLNTDEELEAEDSGVNYEFVGMEKACNFFSDPKKLITVTLNDCKISQIGTITEFPKCTELFLSNNLLTSSEVNKLVEYFPKLTVLDVSENKIDKPINAPSVKTLIMNRVFVEFELVLETLDRCVNVTNLIFSDNMLDEVVFKGKTYPNLTAIDLSNNFIYSWDSICNLFKIFPNLEKLFISHNLLHNLDSNSMEFNSLLELDISNNLISDIDVMVKVSQAFPNLTSLKVNSNPISPNFMEKYSNLPYIKSVKGDKNDEIIRMYMIVTFANLKVLNGTTITGEERTNSERYLNYLEDKEQGEETKTKVNLEKKNRIKVLLVPDGDSESFLYEPVEKKLSESCTVSDVKLLCSKLFKMNLKDIKLVYNNKMMPLCEEMDDDSAELCRYGISDNYQIRVQNKNIKF
ncbi:uncharacterized protein TA14060 [Theileria annulata]|uniref:Ubiquitin-like domain-containing protein n=1 Tax=Theileria annulata TaxID=5874 RepID=Q4UEV3_THEAN|nr:uncharacterized protein TA14060 [Theileria annulata]CAI74386.1 hypothetical protein, conserved [Theileria annulata]|eukprot:XP_952118.1 hypothetical protein, conserved [Theileria annulata]